MISIRLQIFVGTVFFLNFQTLPTTFQNLNGIFPPRISSGNDSTNVLKFPIIAITFSEFE